MNDNESATGVHGAGSGLPEDRWPVQGPRDSARPDPFAAGTESAFYEADAVLAPSAAVQYPAQLPASAYGVTQPVPAAPVLISPALGGDYAGAAASGPVWAVAGATSLAVDDPFGRIPVQAMSPDLSLYTAASAVPPAEPASAAGEVSPPGGAAPLFRRPLVVALGGVGAAVLLVGAGFLAGLSAGRSGSAGLMSAPGEISGVQSAGPGGLGSQLAPGGGSSQGSQGYQGTQGSQGNQAQAMPEAGTAGNSAGEGAGVTVGRITALKGSILTLTSRSGGAVRVLATAATTVNGVKGGAVTSLRVGQVVQVTGALAADGRLTAAAITTRTSRTDTGGSSLQQGHAVGDLGTTGAGRVAGDNSVT